MNGAEIEYRGESYITLAASAEAELSEKRSRFIASAARIETPEQAAELLDCVRERHRDASHHVYAYLLKTGGIRFSDDGEPQGTAGAPVLDIIRHEGLTDTAVVVTRYFGGTLLGTGGLRRCYAGAAKSVLDKAGKAEYIRSVRLLVECDYTSFGRIKYLLESAGFALGEIDYGGEVRIIFTAAADRREECFRLLAENSAGKLRPAVLYELFTPKQVR